MKWTEVVIAFLKALPWRTEENCDKPQSV